MTEFNKRLGKGFRNIRAQGYFARQNFWCCQTCGCHAVPDDKADAYVFYHEQDAGNLRQSQKEGDNVGVYLSWAGDPLVIQKAFEDAGCAVRHNGLSNTRIWIEPRKEN
jgi:hypothetical protein